MNIQKILKKYETHLEKTVTEKRGKIAIKNLEPLYSYTPRNVSKYIDNYVATRQVSRGTINRELAVLSAALRWAFKRGDIDFLPTIQRLPSPPPRSQFLTEAEVQRLLTAAKPYPEIHTFAQIAVMTGQRKEAILSLRWDQIDFDTGLIDFNDQELPMAERRKNRGVVPMSESLRSFLAGLDRDGPYVIHRNGKRVHDIRSDWNRVMEASKLSITPHILRHTVATHLARKNVPMIQISRLLGHKSTAITEKVYAKFSPDFCRDAVSNLNYCV